MTIFEPASHDLEQPDAEQIGTEECRFYVTELTEVDRRQVVTGVDLDTFQFRSFKAILLKEGNAGSNLVFPSLEGHVASRTNVCNRWWRKLFKRKAKPKPRSGPQVKKADLPHIRYRGIHHTRHTFATHALLASPPVEIPVLSKILGDSKPSVTLDIYAHVVKYAETRATATIEKLFG
ncbi:MAG: hypothetical protein JSS49_11545 [Planctomycetes bacterium]|nr:hypothetical protein [Planctomycetota bacterium]